MSGQGLTKDLSSRRVLRVAFNPQQEEQFRRFSSKAGQIHTARDILIAAADIVGSWGDTETERKLEQFADRAEAKEVYPL